MRIACPSCNAAYQVPDEQLTGGRAVRCARCGAEWSPIVDAGPGPERDGASPAEGPGEAAAPPPAEPEAEPARPGRMALDPDEGATPAPVPEPMVPRPAAAAAPAKRGGAALLIAWVLSLLIVAGALAALVVGRDRVMAAWPPSVRAYQALGLAPRG